MKSLSLFLLLFSLPTAPLCAQETDNQLIPDNEIPHSIHRTHDRIYPPSTERGVMHGYIKREKGFFYDDMIIREKREEECPNIIPTNILTLAAGADLRHNNWIISIDGYTDIFTTDITKGKRLPTYVHALEFKGLVDFKKGCAQLERRYIFFKRPTALQTPPSQHLFIKGLEYIDTLSANATQKDVKSRNDILFTNIVSILNTLNPAVKATMNAENVVTIIKEHSVGAKSKEQSEKHMAIEPLYSIIADNPHAGLQETVNAMVEKNTQVTKQFLQQFAHQQPQPKKKVVRGDKRT